MLTLFGLALVRHGVEIVTGEPVACIVAGSVVSRNVFDLVSTGELKEFLRFLRSSTLTSELALGVAGSHASSLVSSRSTFSGTMYSDSGVFGAVSYSDKTPLSGSEGTSPDSVTRLRVSCARRRAGRSSGKYRVPKDEGEDR